MSYNWDEDLEWVTRREFLKSMAATTTAVTIGLISPLYANTERVTKRIQDISGFPVGVREWKPLDITDKINATLGKRKWVFIGGASSSPNNEWEINTKSFYVGEKSMIFYPYASGNKWVDIGSKYGVHFLCNSKSRRVYTLDFDDDRSDYPKGNYPLGSDWIDFKWDQKYWNTLHYAADNGVAIYTSHNKNGIKNIIVANINNSKKTVFKRDDEDPDSLDTYLFNLSGKGNRITAASKGNYYVIDTSNQQIEDQGKGDAIAINYDGSVIAIDNWIYYRKDLSTQEVTLMFDRERTRTNFRFSPDANFCACKRLSFGYDTIDVYIHSTKERFDIDHDVKSDNVYSVDNDGTLHAYSGIYKYRNGMYYWATLGIERSKDLKITKR